MHRAELDLEPTGQLRRPTTSLRPPGRPLAAVLTVSRHDRAIEALKGSAAGLQNAATQLGSPASRLDVWRFTASVLSARQAFRTHQDFCAESAGHEDIVGRLDQLIRMAHASEPGTPEVDSLRDEAMGARGAILAHEAD